ncbi:FAD-dependent oxidoreductase [Gemmatimonadota bacterium]
MRDLLETEITRAILTSFHEKLLKQGVVDVVVVGAGPSSLMAAIDLAGKGHQVTVLEKAGIKATTLLLEGDPAHAIANAAEKEDVSLIMMGSTGKSVTAEMLIGSISEHVALTASRSVLLVH